MHVVHNWQQRHYTHTMHAMHHEAVDQWQRSCPTEVVAQFCGYFNMAIAIIRTQNTRIYFGSGRMS